MHGSEIDASSMDKESLESGDGVKEGDGTDEDDDESSTYDRSTTCHSAPNSLCRDNGWVSLRIIALFSL